MNRQYGYHTGLAAEAIAERQYLAGDYRILEHRWRGSAGEIDLIAQKDNAIIFAEVKARRTHTAAAHAISPRQRLRIADTALEYLEAKGLSGSEIRFDAVLVDRHGASQILENAMSFDDW